MLSKWPSSTKLHSLHVSFHLSSAQTSSVQRYAKVYNSLTTQFIKLLQITLETKLHANDYTRLINNENAALEYINYSNISIFYSQFKSFTSSTCIFLVDQKALTLYSKHPIYNECTLSFESPSYDEVSCLVLFRFLLLIYVFFLSVRRKNIQNCIQMTLCTLLMQYRGGHCSYGLVVTQGDGFKPEKSSKTH